MSQESYAVEANAKSENLYSRLERQPPDALLALIGLHAADPRPDKIDLGVGVYKDARGNTPVFSAVKKAEAVLLKSQQTKGYIGPEGDLGFFNRLLPLIFSNSALHSRIAGFQTPGGTGALRLASEFLKLASPCAQVHAGNPTWANHAPVFAAAGLSIQMHRHIDLASQQITFEEIEAALCRAAPGDAVLLHGCCHNPTGADYSTRQWEALAIIMAQRGLLPIIDLAYQGLGDSLEADCRGVNIVARHCSQMLVAYSCDKNFGLYRERVGALFVLASSIGEAALVHSNLLALARANWSMPPDHGAAVVRIILESTELTAMWRTELGGMRSRIIAMREGIAALDASLGFIASQKGMFSTLDLTPDQVRRLREDHGVYMASSGRIALTGFVPENLVPFAAALAAVR